MAAINRNQWPLSFGIGGPLRRNPHRGPNAGTGGLNCSTTEVWPLRTTPAASTPSRGTRVSYS